jgi:cysteine sulfinate desulfinase/cysteine desulfurase-like protein
MGVPSEDARATVRFSVGRGTTEDDVDAAAEAVAEAANRMRGKRA